MSGADSLLRRCRELEALYELAVELLQLEEPEAMLDRMVGRSLEILGAQRGFLVLVQGETLEVRVARNWSLHAARSLGITREGLRKEMKRHGLS